MEKDLIATGDLQFIRENKKFRFFSGRRLELEPNDLNKDSSSSKIQSFYYRHMTKEQYDYLRLTNQINMVDQNAYVAITNKWSYCNKYFSGIKRNGHLVTHIVEFHMLDGIDLVDRFQEIGKQQLGLNKIQPKVEDGAFSWGLGPQSRSGLLGEEFNRLLLEQKITWRLVNYRQPKGARK